MNREQKRALAGLVIWQVANLFEDWDSSANNYAPELQNVLAAEVKTQLTMWLEKLPGDSWDSRLDISPEEKDELLSKQAFERNAWENWLVSNSGVSFKTWLEEQSESR